jgi:GH15 family glucan-1,4-alpha-glucosidase
MTETAIADHGIIGDLQTAALITTDGSIDWFCCPRFDSPSVFGALLDDARGGHFRIRPTGTVHETRQAYHPETAALITRFITESGVGEVIDFMPPTGATATDNHRLARMLRCVRGRMRFEIDVALRFGYGWLPNRVHTTEHGAVFATEAQSLTLHAVREPDDERLARIRVDGPRELVTREQLGDAGQVRGLVLESAGPHPSPVVGETSEISSTGVRSVRPCVVCALRGEEAR